MVSLQVQTPTGSPTSPVVDFVSRFISTDNNSEDINIVVK